MDRRRRFVPSAEGLDNRVLLSGSTAAANLHQKTIHIENLPKAMASLQPGRVVPQEIVKGLQKDLFALVGRLQPASSAALNATINQYRSTLATGTISQADAAGLRATFRNALETAQAPQATVDSLVTNMDKLVQVDSFGPDSAQLATNDYALILQTALGVGRPIRKPAPPALAASDDDGPKGDHKTTVVQPRLVGTYDPTSTIQLLDEANRVIGTATTNASSQYTVKPDAPLALGKHYLRVQAFDANGNFSPPSRVITITIVATRVRTRHQVTPSTPAGPLGF